MLVLAGVSINAIIGDNGVITNAQNASIRNGMAALEEFLQEEYVDISSSMINNSENEKLTPIEILEMEERTKRYFYIPSEEEETLTLRYIVDSDGNAIYLIKKSGLPTEIQNQLRGGDVGGQTSYYAYAEMKDVYGVTSDLKVYYCSDGKNSIIGVDIANLDKDNPKREIFDNNSKLYSFLAVCDKDNNNKITASEIKSVSELTLDSTITSEAILELYKLNSLKKLILKDIVLSNLNGFENLIQLKDITFENCKIDDYSKLSFLKDKLEKLCMYNITDLEVSNLCSVANGIGGVHFTRLTHLAITGNNLNTWNDTNFNGMYGDSDVFSANLVTDISYLENLHPLTQAGIINLDLCNGQISSVECLSGFTGVKNLRIQRNRIVSLDGIENMENLTGLRANYNLLGQNQTSNPHDASKDSIKAINNKINLKWLNLENNNPLKYISYINTLGKLETLALKNCPNLVVADVGLIADVFNETDATTIDDKFKQYLTGTTKLLYSGLKSTDIDKIDYLKNLSPNIRAKARYLDLSNSNLSSQDLVDIIKLYTNLESINVTGCSNLTSLSFLNFMNDGLREVLIENTGIIGDEVEAFDVYNERPDTNLNCIKMNNVGINLQKMQKTLEAGNGRSSYCVDRYGGVQITSKELSAKIGECKSIESFNSYRLLASGGSYDLSGCTSLKEICNAQYHAVVILPTSIKTITCWGNNRFRLSGMANIEYFMVNQPQNDCNAATGLSGNDLLAFLDDVYSSNSMLSRLRIRHHTTDTKSDFFDNILLKLGRININSLEIGYYGNGVSVSKLDLKSQISAGGWTGSLLNLECLELFTEGETGVELDDLKFLSGNSLLKKLYITKAGVLNLEDIKMLTALEGLRLSGCGISEVGVLSNFKQLEELDLTNNSLYPQGYDENDVPYNNLQILYDLNPGAGNGGSLNQLYIAGNENTLGSVQILQASELIWKPIYDDDEVTIIDYCKSGF